MRHPNISLCTQRGKHGATAARRRQPWWFMSPFDRSPLRAITVVEPRRSDNPSRTASSKEGERDEGCDLVDLIATVIGRRLGSDPHQPVEHRCGVDVDAADRLHAQPCVGPSPRREDRQRASRLELAPEVGVRVQRSLEPLHASFASNRCPVLLPQARALGVRLGNVSVDLPTTLRHP